MSTGRIRQFLAYLVVGFAIALTIAACQQSLSQSPQQAPLAAVAELPTPTLPDWIEQISPTEQAAPLAQVRIRFKQPLIPVEQLDSPNQQALLKKFELAPALPGRFRFLTPRMVGFQTDQALPKATRLRVTLKSGLADLAGHQLEQDLAWTFNTEPILLTDLPGSEGRRGSATDPVALEPTLELTANVELDLDSVRQHLSLTPEGSEAAIPLSVALAAVEARDGYTTPAQAFDPSTRPWIYQLTPQRPLAKATRYALAISAGLRSARGNLPSDKNFDSQVITYAPLAFEGLEMVGGEASEGAYGRFVKGLAQLRFNNGLVADSAIAQITIEPPPKAAPQLVRAYDGDTLVSLNPWALEPATTYKITLGADLQDQFGQTLGNAVTVDYSTGDLAADLWAPSGLNIFPARQNLQLQVSTVNLPQAAYQAAFKVVQPTDLVYTDSAYPRSNGADLLPPSSQWRSIRVANPKNQVTETAIPLREQLGKPTGMLAYGVQARTTGYQEKGRQQWREANFYGLVQLTNLGVFAQWFPDSGLVRVNHLDDGSAAQVPVEIYRSQLESAQRGNPQPCARGQTDQTGTFQLTAQALRQCNPAPETPPELLVIAREGEDWAFVRTWQYSGDYGYGIYADWAGDTPLSRGTIFSDRTLYQPGETAWFTGTAYYLEKGKLAQDKGSRYAVSLTDPNGNSLELGNYTTNNFGTFSLEWPLPANQALGYYSIRAKAADGKEISGEFRVAQFKPPNFKVDLTLDRPLALVNQTVQAQVQSNYLFGPPVQGGEINYYVTRTPLEFTPPGWDAFSFGRQWYWPEERPTVTTDVLQTSATLSPAGSGEVTVKVEPDLPYPMTYRIDAEVVDVSNLSVANAQTFTALPSDRLIGLQHEFVGEGGQPLAVQVVVSDPAGGAIANQRVHLELQKITYSSVTQVIEGSRTQRPQVEYETVAETDLRSGREPKSVELTPPAAGAYRVRASLGQGVLGRGQASVSESHLWVTGASPVYWGGRYTNNRLTVQLDKDRYQPGETATALIQSPYPEAELYFAVIRHDTLYKTLVNVKGGAPQVQFTVTPDMLPNAAVEAILIRQGEPLEQLEPGSLNNLASFGFTPFQVDLADKYLSVQVTPQQPERLPGSDQTIQVSVKDAAGQPVKGQVTLMVVNEAVLQLTGYRPPDLVKTVYAEQPISTRFADNRPDVVLAPMASPLAKGWGYGGGFSAGTAGTRIRTEFKPLAYYKGSVLTNDQGQAQVSFKLPDDLTTWRVMAVATDGALRFGNGDATFVTTQPLITNPVLPPFARPGDRIEAGLSVTNTTNQQGSLTIQAALQNGLRFEGEAATAAQLQTKAEAGTQAYRFPILAEQVGQAQVQFRTQLGNLSDGFQVPLTIEPLMVTEQVVETGTTVGSVTLPINVDENVAKDTGGLEISLASTLLANLQAPVQQIDWTQPLPCLESAASRLTIASGLQALSQQFASPLTDFNPTEQAQRALLQLQTLQQPDGGFVSWPGLERSSPFVTPYAAEAIAQAQQAGLPVETARVESLKGYLQQLLANPGQYDDCQAARCKARVRLNSLIALAALGDVRNQFLSEIYEQRDQFGDVDRIRLARYLSRFPDWQREAQTLSDPYQQVLYETGRTATINLPPTWGWLNSTTTAQAQALRLMIAREANPETLSRLVQGLLALRRDGAWQTSYDNAQALTALVDYARLQPTPPNFDATATLADKPLATVEFQGYQPPRYDLRVAMANLPPGESDLVLEKTGPGTLHYLAAYRYRIAGNPPGRFNGLRVTRELRPANQTDALYQMGLFPPTSALELNVGQVFEVSLEIITDHPVDHVLVSDPLPAGLEAIDASFQTTTQRYQAQTDSWQIGYQTLYRDRTFAYGDHLDAGIYRMNYLVRSVTPGTYLWPGAEVQLQYAPEEFGRSTAATLTIK